MKIKQEDYIFLKDKIKAVDKKIIDEHILQVKETGNYKDLKKRIRWDILWSLGINDYVRDKLYLYMNDEHLDTALKAICNELNII
jgi:hypothetical protein